MSSAVTMVTRDRMWRLKGATAVSGLLARRPIDSMAHCEEPVVGSFQRGEKREIFF